jgi:hypothetical protein
VVSDNTFRAIVLAALLLVWILGWIYAGTYGTHPMPGNY